MKKFMLLLLVVIMMVFTLLPVSAHPHLRLDVFVDNPPYSASVLNVSYIAKLDPIQPVLIEFYTGDPLAGKIPDKLVGQEVIGKIGWCEIRFHQEPGNYAGMAVWNSPLGKVYSNINLYTVRK